MIVSLINHLLEHKLIYTAISFIFGVNIGSFLNVCILRLPKKESIATVNSYCPKCGYILKWYDLVPILSYIFLKGKCRKCKSIISKQYPIVEFITGMVWSIWFYSNFGVINTWSWVLFLIVFNIFIVMSVVDILTYKVSDKAIVTVGILFLAITLIEKKSIIAIILGCVAIVLFFAILDRVFPNAIGGGDVKMLLALVIGYGFMGVQYILFMACATVIIRWLVTKKNKFQFVPHLTLGALIYSLFL